MFITLYAILVKNIFPEKQKREEEKQTEKRKRTGLETDTATEQSDLMLSSDDTDPGDHVELSSLTTSDAHTDAEMAKDLKGKIISYFFYNFIKFLEILLIILIFY